MFVKFQLFNKARATFFVLANFLCSKKIKFVRVCFLLVGISTICIQQNKIVFSLDVKDNNLISMFT